MSTNSECDFVEVEPNVWYYVLEDYDAPKNAFDWRDHATAYGPFKTEDEADRHLRDNHANPGGFCSMRYVEGYKPDATMAKLIEDAQSPNQARSSWRFG